MAKWFKNKETGVTWEVADENVIARLTKDQNFDEIADPTKKKANKKADPDGGATGDNAGDNTGGNDGDNADETGEGDQKQ